VSSQEERLTEKRKFSLNYNSPQKSVPTSNLGRAYLEYSRSRPSLSEVNKKDE
jgi:hypothetical protein